MSTAQTRKIQTIRWGIRQSFEAPTDWAKANAEAKAKP